MHDGLNPDEATHAVQENRKRLLRLLRRRDQGLLFFPMLVIVVLSAGLIMSDRAFWDSHLSFREGSADELAFLTLNLILYIVFRHRQTRKLHDRLQEETMRSDMLSGRLDDLKGILEVSSTVRSTSGLASTLDVIVENARKCLQGDIATLHLRHTDESVIEPRATSTATGIPVEVGSIPVGHGIAGVVAYTGRPIILSDENEVATRSIDAEGVAHMTSVLSVPLLDGREHFGTITVAKRGGTHAFSLSDLQLLIIFADYAGHVIHSARLEDETDTLHHQLRHTEDALVRAQRHMSKSDKLPTVERMVSRLGQDLANPLTSILGYTQLLQQTAREGKTGEYVDNIFDQGRRCRDIVEGFLSYVRGNGAGRFECDLNLIVEQSLELEKRRFREQGIELEARFDAALGPITGNSFLLQEAVLHLLHNAEQALSEVEGERRVSVVTIKEQDRAVLEVRDNGPGVARGCESKIFEPFFSTREDSSSNGLGLPTARRIIEDHGGTLLHGHSTPRGAAFTIAVPLRSAAPLEDAGFSNDAGPLGHAAADSDSTSGHPDDGSPLAGHAAAGDPLAKGSNGPAGSPAHPIGDNGTHVGPESEPGSEPNHGPGNPEEAEDAAAGTSRFPLPWRIGSP